MRTFNIQMKSSWEELSMKDLNDIKQIKLDNNIDDLDKSLYVICALSNASLNDIKNLDLNSYKSLTNKLNFLSSDIPALKSPPTKIKIGEYDCVINYDISAFTVGQFIDFHNLRNNVSDLSYSGELLSIFIIPKGHKYAEGYDIKALQDEIYNNMSCIIGKGMLDFFTLLLKSYMKGIRHYLEGTLKTMKKKAMKEKDNQQLMMEITKVETAINDLF